MFAVETIAFEVPTNFLEFMQAFQMAFVHVLVMAKEVIEFTLLAFDISEFLNY